MLRGKFLRVDANLQRITLEKASKGQLLTMLMFDVFRHSFPDVFSILDFVVREVVLGEFREREVSVTGEVDALVVTGTQVVDRDEDNHGSNNLDKNHEANIKALDGSKETLGFGFFGFNPPPPPPRPPTKKNIFCLCLFP